MQDDRSDFTGHTTPCRMSFKVTAVILHEVASPESRARGGAHARCLLLQFVPAVWAECFGVRVCSFGVGDMFGVWDSRFFGLWVGDCVLVFEVWGVRV